MTNIPTPNAGKPAGLPGVLLAAAALLDRIPQSLISLAARIFPAAVFWRSGETKVDNAIPLFKVEHWHLADSAIDLFRDEYRLPFIDPEIAAKIAAFSEHFFPVLLVIGLASRLSALALLGMTAVIEIFVYPYAWPEQGVWADLFSGRHRPRARHFFA